MAYQTLYESAIAFGMRKALMAEQKKADMEQEIQKLQDACDEKQKEVERLDQEIEDIIRKDEEERQRD